MAAGKYVRAAARLIAILGEREAALAGGLAVNAHGFIRATRDVDVIVSIPLAEARRRLARHGIDARLFKGDPLEGDFPCLKGVIGVAVGRGGLAGVPFDVLPQLVPLDPERTIELSLRDQTLRVVDLDTLIRLKLKAGAPQDLYDVAVLVNLHPDWEARAKELAASAPDRLRRLTGFIDDPRVRGKAREAKRQDKLLREFARRLRDGRASGRGPQGA